MSHFSVLVKIRPEDLGELSIEEAVEQKMRPYQENNMCDCPKEFLKFNDMTDEIQSRYHEVHDFVSYNNELSFTYKYRDGKYPEGSNIVPAPLSEYYDSFEQYVEDYHGYEYDEDQQAYGYWENPNAKWDWWQVGGRWRGLLRVKEGTKPIYGDISPIAQVFGSEEENAPKPYQADVAKVKDIDFEGMDLEVDIKIKDWYERYKEYRLVEDGIKNKEDLEDSFIMWDVPRVLKDIGALRCIEPRKPIPDKFDENGKQQYTDIVFEEDVLTLEDLQQYRWYWEFGTWAVLDHTGWYEKGEMGWWGLSTATPEDKANFSKSYMDNFIKNENPETYLVVVDCHI
jgi:hypothetical protein